MRKESSTTSLPVSEANSFAMPASRSERSPASFMRAHHLREAFAEPRLFAAEDHLGGAAVAVEDELGRLDALVAHLLDLGRDVEAGVLRRARLLLAHEAGHPAVRRIGVLVG